MQIGRAVHGPDALLFGLAFSARLERHGCPIHRRLLDPTQYSGEFMIEWTP
jgi:hypothetical protein